jgi:Tfp pilus assembly protein PilF
LFAAALTLVVCACTTTSLPKFAEAPPPKARVNPGSTESGLPPTPKTLYALARLLEARQDYEAAALVYETIMKEHKAYLPVYTDFATLLARRGRLDLAEQVLEKGIKVEANDPLLHNNLGVIHVLRSDYAGALGEFDRAGKLSPEDPRYRANQALALGLLGRYDEALARYEGVLSPADAQYNLNVIRNIVHARNQGKSVPDGQLGALMGLQSAPSPAEPAAEPVPAPEPPVTASVEPPAMLPREEGVSVAGRRERDTSTNEPHEAGTPVAESTIISVGPSSGPRPDRPAESSPKRDEPVSTAKVAGGATSAPNPPARVEPIPPPAERAVEAARPEPSPQPLAPRAEGVSVQPESAVPAIQPPVEQRSDSKPSPTPPGQAMATEAPPVEREVGVSEPAVKDPASEASPDAETSSFKDVAVVTPSRVKTNIVIAKKSDDADRDEAKPPRTTRDTKAETPASPPAPPVTGDKPTDETVQSAASPTTLARAAPTPASSTAPSSQKVSGDAVSVAAARATAPEAMTVTVIDAQPIESSSSPDSPEPDAPADSGLPAAKPGTEPPRSGYTIQVAAFDYDAPERAQRYKSRVEEKTEYEVMLIISNDKKRIRACVGSYPDAASAYKAKRKLEKVEDFAGCFVRELDE